MLTSALIAYWQRYCWAYKLGVCKPVQSGVGDRELYTRLFQLDQPLEQLNPLWYPTPIAPPLAAAREGTSVDLAKAWQAVAQLQAERDWVIVEGAGGLGSPITDELTVADIATQWHLPTVLVVPVRLGAIADSVATAALARQKRVQLLGIVLSCTEPCTQEQLESWAPVSMIERLAQVPVLGILPFLRQVRDLSALSDAAAQLDLEQIMPKAFGA